MTITDIIYWTTNAVATLTMLAFITDAIVHFIRGQDTKALRSLLVVVVIAMLDLFMSWVLKL